MRISHQYRFVFLSLPRTGSTTARELLDPWSDVKSVHISQVTAAHPFYHHISAAELKAIFDRQGWDWYAYRRFCFVRNPFDRMVSLYHHSCKLWRDKSLARLSFLHLLRYAYYRVRGVPTFAQFIAGLDTGNRLMTTLGDFINGADGRPLVDDILHFEEFNTALATYMENLGIELSADSIPRINQSTARQPYTHYYTPASRQRVAELFQEEIERCGYQF